MTEIKCQECKGKKRENGCGTCGGYGVLITKATTEDGVKYWTRPRRYTVYVGKRFRSFDGVELIIGKDWKTYAYKGERGGK